MNIPQTLEDLGNLLAAGARAHPRIAGGLVVWIIVDGALLACLRGAVPLEANRPPWMRGLIAFLDFFYGNFWTITKKILPKFLGDLVPGGENPSDAVSITKSIKKAEEPVPDPKKEALRP